MKSQKCNQCDYASSDAGNLMRHLKTHSGEKLNKCNQCDYASSQTGNLRRHLKTHSGEKSNRCNQCDYASSQTVTLWRHLKTHSGEKSKKCNQCSYASSRADSLRIHLKKHNGKNHDWSCFMLNEARDLGKFMFWNYFWTDEYSNMCMMFKYRPNKGHISRFSLLDNMINATRGNSRNAHNSCYKQTNQCSFEKMLEIISDG